MPRLDSPRSTVPAGSVALAGTWCGGLPDRVAGRLAAARPHRRRAVGRRRASEPALLPPGTRVRFVAAMSASPSLDAGALTTVQDRGRVGLAHLGVPRAGALDRPAAGAGEPAGRQPGRRGRAGGDCSAGFVARAERRPLGRGHRCAVPGHRRRRPGRARRGRVAARRAPSCGSARPRPGVRSYLAVAGGVDVEPVLGSRSTDTLAWVGPARVEDGAELPVGAPAGEPQPHDTPAPAAEPGRCGSPRGRAPTGSPTTRSPRSAPRRTSWTADSNRIGLRLERRRAVADAATASSPARGWCSGRCRCRRTGSRWCSWPTTRRPAATR